MKDENKVELNDNITKIDSFKLEYISESEEDSSDMKDEEEKKG